MYDANENIVPSDFVVMQAPLTVLPSDPVNNADLSASRAKGSHPRRTYIGIKARRKRMSEGETQGTGTGDSGMEQDSPYATPLRKRFRNSDESSVDQDGNPIQGEGQSEQEDWREQLYHWRGHLSVDIPHKTAVWKGTWMTSWQIQQQQEGNAPNPSWNNNTFEYRCPSYSPAPEIIAKVSKLHFTLFAFSIQAGIFGISQFNPFVSSRRKLQWILHDGQ